MNLHFFFIDEDNLSRSLSIQENLKYVKYKNLDCSEIYDTYEKLFGDTGSSTKCALSPTKLSQCSFDLGTDSEVKKKKEMKAASCPSRWRQPNPVAARSKIKLTHT